MGERDVSGDMSTNGVGGGDGVSAMGAHWDDLARRDARYFIATRRGGWDGDEEFYASGRIPVERILGWIGPTPARSRALEIGPGIGRILVNVAEHFQRADGVDASRQMIEQATARGLPANVTFHLGNGRDLAAIEDASVDVVYSLRVFQHIPDLDVIASYLAETARVLAPGGRAVLQFDTRPARFVQRLYQALPDALLPRVHRRYMRRYRRDADEIRRLMREAGLVIVDERDAASAIHWFLLAVDG